MGWLADDGREEMLEIGPGCGEEEDEARRAVRRKLGGCTHADIVDGRLGLRSFRGGGMAWVVSAETLELR